MTGSRPVLIWDGDCGFCRRWIARWRRRTKGRVLYVPFQRLGDRWPQVSRKACEDAVQLVDVDGRVYSGADAIIRLLDHGVPGGGIIRFICSHPPVIWAMRLGYGFVAANRRWFSRLEKTTRRRR